MVGLREKLALNDASGVEVALKVLLAGPGLFVEARIFESDGDEGAEDFEHALVLVGEGVHLGAFQIEDADETILQEERDDQFGAHVVAVRELDVTLVLADVGDTDRAAVTCAETGDALVEGDGELDGDGFVVVFGEGAFEMGVGFVPEHEIEEVVVDDGFDAVGDAEEEFVAVEDGS
jgi:hypothetical protein